MSIDTLHYELLTLERYIPYATTYINNFSHKNKFYQAFIRYKVNKIISLCDTLLITNDGHPNFENIEELKKHGYYVGPGEKDRFGWLTGVVGTSKGDIVFG